MSNMFTIKYANIQCTEKVSDSHYFPTSNTGLWPITGVVKPIGEPSKQGIFCSHNLVLLQPSRQWTITLSPLSDVLQWLKRRVNKKMF